MEEKQDNYLSGFRTQDIYYAGFGPRFVALFMDGLILIPVYLLTVFNNMYWTQIFISIICVLAAPVYRTFFEFIQSATPGKKIAKIKVVNLQYEKINLQEALLRNSFTILFAFISLLTLFLTYNGGGESTWLIMNVGGKPMSVFVLGYYVLYIIDFIMLVTDKQSRSLHDRIAGTYVVKVTF